MQAGTPVSPEDQQRARLASGFGQIEGRTSDLTRNRALGTFLLPYSLGVPSAYRSRLSNVEV